MTENIKTFDVMLIDWSKSSAKRGPRVTIQFTNDEDLEYFEGMTVAKAGKCGQLLEIAVQLAEADPQHGTAANVATTVHHDTRPYGGIAELLYLSGFSCRPEVLTVLGTPDEYLEWLRGQKCIHARYDKKHICGGSLVAAHVRRISKGAGEAKKPDYYAVPLCQDSHAKQHQYGESAVLPRDTWDMFADTLLRDWSWLKLRAALKCESISTVSPALVQEWAREHFVEKFLPVPYMDAGKIGHNG